jgi:Rhodopirellula transposase DDE domain
MTDAASYDDTTAVSQHIVDVGATNLQDLLTKVNGRSVKLNAANNVTLQTTGVTVQTIEPSAIDTLYSLIIDPNVTFLLFVVAIRGDPESPLRWTSKSVRKPAKELLGMDHDTAAFAVESLRRWWNEVGWQQYPEAKRLLISADGGGSNGSRVRLWNYTLFPRTGSIDSFIL